MSNASFANQFDPAHAEPHHEVQFYEFDEDLAAAVSRYLAEGFRNGNAMVVIAGPEHAQLIRRSLKHQGFSIDAAISSGQYREIDARLALAGFMDEELPNRERFHSLIQPILKDSLQARKHAPVLAFGEMVNILVEDDRSEAALRLEELWNELAGEMPFKLFCGYSLHAFDHPDRRVHFDRIRKAHNHVTTPETGLNGNSPLEREAQLLRTEVKARKEIERALLTALDEKRKVEEQLRKADSQLRSVLQNAAEGIHWVALDGRILWANHAELALLGYTQEEYVGRDIREFHADGPTIADILGRLSEGELLQNYPARLRAKDGSIRHVLINSNVLEEGENGPHTQCFTRDVTELNAAFEAQAFLSAVVQSATDAIVSETLGGIITSWNPGAERILGYRSQEVVGRSITILMPPDYEDELPAIVARLRHGDRIEDYETRRVRKDGTLIDVSLAVSLIRNNAGEIIGVSKIARDITARKRLEAERAQLHLAARVARDEAEAANRVKDDFLALVSHELRTPLSAVIGWASILEARRDEDTVVRGLTVIKRNADLQKRMIEDLLDIARILTGKLVLKTERLNMRNIVQLAIDSNRPAAQAKSIRLDTDFEDSIPSINGDSDRLQQVVSNLLSNSVKFTPEHGYVYISLIHAGAWIELDVRDTGPGISAEFLPRVFERFSQGDTSKSRAQGGLGIGLALVRHITEAHHGTVSVKSPGEGFGTTFTVRLPIA